MNFAKIKLKLKEVLAKEEKALGQLAREIHCHPELSFQEYQTSELLIQYLQKNNFKIERHLAGLKTSFRAFSQKGTLHPAIAFLAEMDALANLGHGCGHNLIAVSSLGAGLILRKAFPTLEGTIEIIGCPAEERGGGKVIMDNAGVFEHLDFAMLIHPSNRTEIYKLSLALVEVKLTFLGKASHASASPEKGINALEALLQTFNGINALRSQITGYTHINGIITEGGKAPNIIPDRASAEFWVRDETLERALEYAEKVVAVARSSAKALGAKVKAHINRRLAYRPFLPNRTAGKILQQAYEELGIKIQQGDERSEMGSTDLGNLSWRVPALHPTILISKAVPHTAEFTQASGSASGFKAMKKAILAMALTGYQVMTDPVLRRKMKAELRANQRLK